MAAENQNPVDNDVIDEQPVDYKALYEASKSELDKIKPNYEKLNKETRDAKAARETAVKEAERIKLEKAQQDGEYETLWKTEKNQREELLKQLQDVKQSNRQEKINLAAMKIANSIAEGDNADILSKFISENVGKVADETGVVTSDVIAAIEKEYANNSKFKSLLKGSKASGGDAPGNTSNKPVATKDEKNMTPIERMNKSRGI